jgi:hypothetical protein
MNIIVLGLAFLAIVIHLVRLKERSAKNIVEVVLLYLLIFPIGLGCTIAGLFHIFNGPATAAMIGWPAGSPFQYEVGVADLAFGLLGLLCLFFRGNFWLAAILANSAFLLGAMAGHLHDLLASGNQAAYNIGPNIIFADLIMPLVLIGLYLALQKLPKD